eukprot:6492387-Amphidinium_carterae.5
MVYVAQSYIKCVNSEDVWVIAPPMASLAALAAGIRDTAVSSADKITVVDENLKQEYLAHTGPIDSVVLETKTGQLQVVKAKQRPAGPQDYKGDWSWKRPQGKYGRQNREESLASSQGRPHQYWADSPLSPGSMLPPPMRTSACQGHGDTSWCSRLPLLAVPPTLNFDTWVQWLIVQANDWANFAIIDGSCIEAQGTQHLWWDMLRVPMSGKFLLKEAFSYFDVDGTWDILQEAAVRAESQNQEEDPISKRARLTQKARSLTNKLSNDLADLSTLVVTIEEDETPIVSGSAPKKRARNT